MGPPVTQAEQHRGERRHRSHQREQWHAHRHVGEARTEAGAAGVVQPVEQDTVAGEPETGLDGRFRSWGRTYQ